MSEAAQAVADIQGEIADMSFTQEIRKEAIKVLKPNAFAEKNIEQINVILKAADGIDKQVIAKMRNRQHERENDTKDKEVGVMSDYLIKLGEKRKEDGATAAEIPTGPSRMKGRALPKETKPNYDPVLASTQARIENSQEFNERMDTKQGKTPTAST
jgi:hypothetical protein